MSGRGHNRREIAARIAAAALLPLATLGAPLSSVIARTRVRTAPSGSYALERMLTRELGAGASIVVTRRWRVDFALTQAGIVVAGEQTFAEVAAPPALSPLAALEESRSTEGLFPIQLDSLGRIAGSERGMDAAYLLRAIDAGQALLRKAGAPDTRQDARAFMMQLASMSAEVVSALPRDLFFPAAGRSTAAHDLTLPGGEKGTISVDTAASADADTGLLRMSERVIVTRIGGSARTAREGWILARIR